MFTKQIKISNTFRNHQTLFDSFLKYIYSPEEYLEKPENITRYKNHMKFMFMSLAELENFTPGELPHQKRFFKLFSDAPSPQEASQIILNLQKTYLENKALIDALAYWHDPGKLKANPNHARFSLQKFDFLTKSKNPVDSNSPLYSLFQTSIEHKKILRILIKYHELGSINFDGNYGSIYLLEKELKKQNLTPSEIEELHNILKLFIPLDRAAVPDLHGEGFCTYYDYIIFEQILTKILSGENIFSNAEDIAAYIARQYVMVTQNKTKVFNESLPQITNILKKLFSPQEIVLIKNQLNKIVPNIHSLYYLNGYLFHFAFGGEIEKIKDENYYSIPEIQKRFTLIKLLVTLGYQNNLETIMNINEYSNSKEKDIFAVKEQNLLETIRDYLHGLYFPIFLI